MLVFSPTWSGTNQAVQLQKNGVMSLRDNIYFRISGSAMMLSSREDV